MELSKQAISILEELQDEEELKVHELKEKGYDQAMVNRAALELEEKDLLETEEKEVTRSLPSVEYRITDQGKEILERGSSPEYNLIEKLKDESVSTDDQFWNKSVAIGQAQKLGWIRIQDGEISLTEEGTSVSEDEIFEKLEILEGGLDEAPEEIGYYDDIFDRNLARFETSKKKTVRTLKLTEEGYEIDTGDVEVEFNVEAEAETPRIGKTHFYKDILGFAREKFVEMGFREMSGDFVVPGLLNFDALYTPQDHPARDLQDTFFMDKPEKSDLSEYGDKVQHVKKTHEDGWDTGSSGWKYDWNQEEAKQNVLRTHTTAVSARRLHEIDVNEEELPKKFFIIGRNFRNETVDRTHLAGFIQLDGIVVGENLNFRNLKAYLSEFFEKMGYSEFRLIPSYYPYTEMSVEVQVWDEEEEAWLGMGGAGLFRPEVVRPLLGFEATVLAWGLGLGRVAMKAAGIDDIRELYRNDIEILEKTPKWRPG